MTKRALVLGGGGPVGIAWEFGLLAGFGEEGLDASQADFIVGTSAGSVVGAQLTMGRPPASLAAQFLTPREEQQPPSASQLLGTQPPDLSALIGKMQAVLMDNRPPQQALADLGTWALQCQTIGEDAFIASFGRALQEFPEGAWPGAFACTAVDTADGSFTVWNREAGVGLARAVASSCSVPGIYPPVTIRGRRYMDGGMRSATNADLAKGYGVVIVVAATAGTAVGAMAQLFRERLETELQTLRDSGSRVELIVPDQASVVAFGENLMDFRRRPGAAKAGLQQGRNEAARLRPAWCGG